MSGCRPPLRSPKFAEGMTSDAIDESGVKSGSSAQPLGIGSARGRFDSGLSVEFGMTHSKRLATANGSNRIWARTTLLHLPPAIEIASADGCEKPHALPEVAHELVASEEKCLISATDHQRFVNAERRY